MLQGLVTVVCIVLLHIRISSADTNPGDGKQLSLSFFSRVFSIHSSKEELVHLQCSSFFSPEGQKQISF